MPRPFYPRGKSPRYPLDSRLGGPQSQSGQHREVKILAPTGTQHRPLGCPAHSQSLSRHQVSSHFSLINLLHGAESLFERIKAAQQEVLAFYGIKSFITILTWTFHQSLSWAIWSLLPCTFYFCFINKSSMVALQSSVERAILTLQNGTVCGI
jgi:hypothetical protein